MAGLSLWPTDEEVLFVCSECAQSHAQKSHAQKQPLGVGVGGDSWAEPGLQPYGEAPGGLDSVTAAVDDSCCTTGVRREAAPGQGTWGSPRAGPASHQGG